MIAARMRDRFVRPPADEVQLLIVAESKPGARKGERRPGHLRQTQHFAIELAAPLDIGNMQSNMVECDDFHNLQVIASQAKVRYSNYELTGRSIPCGG